jgi:hypothetical protein
VPAQQSLRGHDCGNLRQHLSPKSSGFGRESPALVIGEPQPSIAELFPKDAVLFAQVLDHVQLALIHPSGKRDQEKTEGVERCRHLVAFIIDELHPAQQRGFNEFRFSGHSATSEGWHVQWESVPPGQELEPRSLGCIRGGNEADEAN